jgi:hypothetical protein
MAEGYVVKLLDNNGTLEPRWVMTEGGRGFGTREGATVFPDREAADSESEIWKAMSPKVFSVVVEPA